MCWIYGYQGPKTVRKELLQGLEKLEYRGYDSGGMILMDEDGHSQVIKSVGKVSELSSQVMTQLKNSDLKFNCGIGHTRWATHGGVTTINAHPHRDMNQTFFVVHNGIIENYQSLKKELEADGVVFISQTDTEVIPNLLAKYWTGDFLETVEKVLPMLHGAYALVIVTTHAPGQMIGVKLASPLMFGVKGDEYYLSSDMPSLANKVDEVYVLDEGELVFLDKNEFVIKSEGERIYKQASKLDNEGTDVSKGKYEHRMLKEIMEQPDVIGNALLGRLNLETGEMVASSLTYLDQYDFDSVCFVACGTSYHAGLYGTYAIENISWLSAQAHIASEFEYRNIKINPKTLYVFLSQSGETADSIDCLKKIQAWWWVSFGIVNVVWSTISRMTDCGMFMRAGAEIGVASTKAFTAQLTIVLLLSLYFAKKHATSSLAIDTILWELKVLPRKIRTLLSDYSHITGIAKKLSEYHHCFFLGKHYQLPIAYESSLKLKEISYIHSEAYAMAELKHGPLALLDDRFPVVAFCPQDAFYAKNVSSIQEAKSRLAPIISIGDNVIDRSDYHILIPDTIDVLYPFLTCVVGQLLAYETARVLWKNIDKPRNLAKSVTVK